MKRFLPVLRLISVFAVIGLAVGVAASFLITPKWEAVSVIKQAQILNPSMSLISNNSKYQNSYPDINLESYDVLINRFRAPSVLRSVLEGNKQRSDSHAFKNLLKDTRISNLTDAIELRVRATSPEAAVNISQLYLIAVAAEQVDWIKQTNNGIRILTPVSFVVLPSAFPFPVTPRPLLVVTISVTLATALGFVVALILRK